MPPRRDPDPADVLRDLARTIETLTTRLDGQATVQAATAQILQQIQAAFQQMPLGNQNVGQGDEGNQINKLMNHFRKANPPSFLGEPDPVKAERWIMQLEKIFGVLNCSSEQKVLLAAYMLEGEAEYWWKGAKRLLEMKELPLTWVVFVETFYDKYFPENIKNKKEAEFLTLHQEDMTVAQYIAKFEELSKFSKYLKETHDEAWKCIHFERGLKPEIRDRVATHEIREYPKLISVVRIAEENFMACKAENERKIGKRIFPEASRGKEKLWNKKQKTSSVSNRKTSTYSQQASSQPICQQCGKNHAA